MFQSACKVSHFAEFGAIACLKADLFAKLFRYDVLKNISILNHLEMQLSHVLIAGALSSIWRIAREICCFIAVSHLLFECITNLTINEEHRAHLPPMSHQLLLHGYWPSISDLPPWDSTSCCMASSISLSLKMETTVLNYIFSTNYFLNQNLKNFSLDFIIFVHFLKTETDIIRIFCTFLN